MSFHWVGDICAGKIFLPATFVVSYQPICYRLKQFETLKAIHFPKNTLLLKFNTFFVIQALNVRSLYNIYIVTHLNMVEYVIDIQFNNLFL